MAAMARMCEWSAHSSISSRVMPHLSAVFSPTVTPMLRVGASGVSGWLSGMKPDTRVRHALEAAGDDDLVHPRLDRRGRGVDGLQPAPALPVHGHAGRVGRQAQVDGDVTGQVAAALQHLAHHHVVDVVGGDTRTLQGLGDGDLAQLDDRRLRQRALEGVADRRAGEGDDNGFRHDGRA